MSSYVYSGPGYASDLASGKVSLNTSLSNASEYSKYVSGSSGSANSNDLLDHNSAESVGSSSNDWFSYYDDAYDRAIEQDELNREYNSAEAQKNRDWQTEMSNTSYQRAVEDLKKAGLNPVLAIKGLSGASTPSGSSASYSGSAASGVLSNVVSAAVNSAISSAEISSKEKISANELQNKLDVQALAGYYGVTVSEISANASMYNALVMSEASKYSSDNSFLASVYGSDKAYSSSVFASWVNQENNKRTNDTNFNISLNQLEGTKYSADSSYAYNMYKTNLDLWIKENIPQNSMLQSAYAYGNQLGSDLRRDYQNLLGIGASVLDAIDYSIGKLSKKFGL